MMYAWMLVSFAVIAAGAFAVRHTAHQAKDPRKWSRNGLLGIATISTALMAGLIGARNPAAFAILGVWMPAMIAGILGERWYVGRQKPD